MIPTPTRPRLPTLNLERETLNRARPAVERPSHLIPRLELLERLLRRRPINRYRKGLLRER